MINEYINNTAKEGEAKRFRFAAPSFGTLEKYCFMRSVHFDAATFNFNIQAPT